MAINIGKENEYLTKLEELKAGEAIKWEELLEKIKKNAEFNQIDKTPEVLRNDIYTADQIETYEKLSKSRVELIEKLDVLESELSKTVLEYRDSLLARVNDLEKKFDKSDEIYKENEIRYNKLAEKISEATERVNELKKNNAPESDIVLEAEYKRDKLKSEIDRAKKFKEKYLKIREESRKEIKDILSSLDEVNKKYNLDPKDIKDEEKGENKKAEEKDENEPEVKTEKDESQKNDEKDNKDEAALKPEAEKSEKDKQGAQPAANGPIAQEGAQIQQEEQAPEVAETQTPSGEPLISDMTPEEAYEILSAISSNKDGVAMMQDMLSGENKEVGEGITLGGQTIDHINYKVIAHAMKLANEKVPNKDNKKISKDLAILGSQSRKTLTNAVAEYNNDAPWNKSDVEKLLTALKIGPEDAGKLFSEIDGNIVPNNELFSEKIVQPSPKKLLEMQKAYKNCVDRYKELQASGNPDMAFLAEEKFNSMARTLLVMPMNAIGFDAATKEFRTRHRALPPIGKTIATWFNRGNNNSIFNNRKSAFEDTIYALPEARTVSTSTDTPAQKTESSVLTTDLEQLRNKVKTREEIEAEEQKREEQIVKKPKEKTDGLEK